MNIINSVMLLFHIIFSPIVRRYGIYDTVSLYGWVIESFTQLMRSKRWLIQEWNKWQPLWFSHWINLQSVSEDYYLYEWTWNGAEKRLKCNYKPLLIVVLQHTKLDAFISFRAILAVMIWSNFIFFKWNIFLSNPTLDQVLYINLKKRRIVRFLASSHSWCEGLCNPDLFPVL